MHFAIELSGRARHASAWPTISLSVLVLLLTLACSPAGRATPADPNLQDLINAAKPGDTIVLPAGSVFTGSFVLPAKSGDATITITTSDASSLPPGARVTPADRSHLVAIRTTNNTPALATAPGAHNYKLVGLEIYSENVYNSGILQLGLTEDSLAKLPRQIEVDRSYIHGDAAVGAKRGIAMNGISLSVRNSYISDIKSADQDTQAISGWNGPGPFQIVNNYLEAAGENILFGGATGPIAGVVPSDIEIRGNYMFKPLSWKKGDPSFGGTAWQVKNLLELKSARRILITGNILENNWPHAQNGFAVLFTVRTQDDTCPWCIIEDVTFENNLLRNIYAGVNILGQDGVGRAHRMIVRNNFWQTESTLFQVLTEAEDVTFEHNTAVNGHSVIVLDGKPSPRLVFVNNLVMNAKYGIIGGGAAPGLGSIQRYLPAARIQKNVIIGANASDYPAGNFFPALPAHVLFQNSSSDDYRLAPSSPYRSAGTDGQDLGANMVRIRQATATTIAGR